MLKLIRMVEKQNLENIWSIGVNEWKNDIPKKNINEEIEKTEIHQEQMVTLYDVENTQKTQKIASLRDKLNESNFVDYLATLPILDTKNGLEINGETKASFDRYINQVNIEPNEKIENWQNDKLELKDMKRLDEKGLVLLSSEYLWQNEMAKKLFQNLINDWFKIYVNTKTDVCFTNSNTKTILLWIWPVSTQSKETMWFENDKDVHIAKLIHEMCHTLYSDSNKLYEVLKFIRSKWVENTKLWNLPRYKELNEKASEDVVEFIRMYIQNPDQFKEYVWKIFENHLSTIFPPEAKYALFNMTKNIVDKFMQR